MTDFQLQRRLKVRDLEVLDSGPIVDVKPILSDDITAR
jgi:tRNA (Thr-GGU) A37 N-methylase